ncbi:hypothetical protein O9H85_16560 [Paenibacillus filicis]|uniref:Uncharacterized protein n=1 Tax=Paenibacillus gyeongsangnamensis TaxID=3388067 RepID=A0ABT4QAU6_9BACL|nr:CBO0543 family protein [Paenibacillus filicis]MCZ8514005.1 hypothetical protein [Paenibacillus filicis]
MRGISAEAVLLCIAYGGSLAALVLVPNDRRRESQAVFLFFGLVTWVLGLAAVEAGWLTYPVREFQSATQTSFVFEFLAFPVVSIYFNLYFPQGRSPWIQAGYGGAFAAAITVPEFFIEKYTQLIEYHGWTWYWTFVSVMLTLWVSRLFYVWFFRVNGKA